MVHRTNTLNSIYILESNTHAKESICSMFSVRFLEVVAGTKGNATVREALVTQ